MLDSNISSHKSRSSAKSVPLVPDRRLRSRKSNQPQPSIGAIFRSAKTQAATAEPSTQSNVQVGEQLSTMNKAEVQQDIYNEQKPRKLAGTQ